MAGVLHGSARTPPRVRADLHASKESTRTLAEQYGLNPKTVAKWRKRTTTADAPLGPHLPRSSVLTPVEEAMVVEFRRRTLVPLDDVLGCLRKIIPTLTRSALHRCLQRHGISRMDGRSRWMDNVFIERLWRSMKYECVYLHAFETGSELRDRLRRWVGYDNAQRPHSSLTRRTPYEAYHQSATPPCPGHAPDREANTALAA